MFSKELEVSIGQCYKQARESRHEFMTVDHLLLALLDNASAANVLRSCGADIDLLAQGLRQAINENVSILPEDDARDTQPTLGFQRVLQRAVYHVQSSGKKEVNGANVLVAIFSEKDSHSVYLMQKQDITRLDVVNYLSHGMARGSEQPEEVSDEAKNTDGAEETKANALAEYAVNLNELALEGRIDPLIGREDEVERTIQILCRRRKNNPLYVGDPGVGKTALAEGLAWR
ncbi:MAG: ATP-dependent Clp protease ATP-binding subunit ClpA, partial [Arenimonas sp.]|nr:ATP-dependent Clp protease ATP-binding subunit ClpA [Arenimonas sp.]